MAAPQARRPRVLAIVGLTGTGKTELACEVARRTRGEVIGADSMQVYRGLDIGTAKPSPQLRDEIPHHLIDVTEPDDPMTAGRYAALARAAAREIVGRQRPILLCGGTGLYARAFAGGLMPGVESDASLRRSLESRTTADLRAELERTDPAAALAIEPNDRVRSVRALEIQHLSGRRFSERVVEHGFVDRPFDVRWIALDMEREALWTRLHRRAARMFAEGLVEEVACLLERGLDPGVRPLQSIGYRQASQVLAGTLTRAEAVEQTFLATRRYAKRQRTWFRAEADVEWLDAANPEAALRRAMRLLQAWPASARC